MRPGRSFPRALRRPALVAFALALRAGAAAAPVRAEEAPSAAGAKAAAPEAPSLGTPVPPGAPSDADRDVGLVALATGAGTTAGLRTDGRVLVRTGEAERVVDPPADVGDFRVLCVAGDGVPVVVTTHGRIVLLEPKGARVLALAVQRSAKPAAIPGSNDVVLGSENGSIRRLLRGESPPRLADVVPSGDEPVAALAAGADRVAYARLDGFVLEVALSGGEPRTIRRPTGAVTEVRVARATTYVLEGGALVAIPSRTPSSPAPTAVGPARTLAVSADGSLVARLDGDELEVLRVADGARVASRALGARTPTALAFEDDGRTLLVATRADARPWRVPVTSGEARPR